MCDPGCRSLPSPPGPSPLGLTSWQDDTLKQSFLTAILMLVGAVSRNEGAHSYEFSQLPQLLESLMVSTRFWGTGRGGGAPPGTSSAHERRPLGRVGRWISGALQAFTPGTTSTFSTSLELPRYVAEAQKGQDHPFCLQ